MHPAPIRENEAARLRALRRLELLDTEDEAELDELTALAASVCEAPIALLTLVDENRQWFKSRVGLEVRETPRDVSFCGHAIHDDDLFEVPDARADPRFFDNPFVQGAPGVRFYAAAPLRTSEGLGLGTLCVVDHVPRVLDDRQRRALGTLGRVLLHLLERRAADRELRRLDAKLSEKIAFERTILDTTGTCIVSFLPDGAITGFNAGAQQLLGFGAEDVVGRMNVASLYDASDLLDGAEVASARLGRPIPPGVQSITLGLDAEPQSHEALWTRRDGTRMPVHVALSAMRGPEGQTTGYVALIRDLRERRQIEAAQHRSEQLLGSLTTLAPVGIFRTDPAGRCVFVNDSYGELTGLDPAGALGDGWASALHPEDRERVSAAWSRATHARRKFSMEYRFVHSDGQVRWVLGQSTEETDPDGRVTGHVGVLTDITERKKAEAEMRAINTNLEHIVAERTAALFESERRHRTLLDNLPGMVFRGRFDGQWIMDVVSAGCLALTGYTAEALVSANPHYRDLIHPDDLPTFRAEFEGAIRRRGRFSSEHRIRHASGELRWVSVNGAGVFADDGRLLLVEGLITDVSERRRAEEARAALEGQIRQAQKLEAIGTLAGGIAHDFNNILGGILGSAELAQEELPREEPAQAHIAQIRRSSLRGRDLVQQILAFSRPQEQEQEKIDLRAVVREALQILHSTLPKTTEIVRALDAPTSLVRANRTQILQIVMNLATNAHQALAGRPGRLELTLAGLELGADQTPPHPGLAPGAYVVLTVGDDGPGMAPATLDRIFDPFFTTKGPGEGTGLGLFVVHGIVKAHGGVVAVESALGEGTRFHLYFPALAERPRDSAHTSPRKVPSEHGALRILFVDDEAPLVNVGKRLLERRGHEVTGHTRPDAAIAQLQHDPGAWDLVVADYNMPGCSGIELARIAHGLRPDLPILLTSGRVTDALQAEAAALGIRFILSKPYGVAELTAAVGRFSTKSA